MQVLEEMKAQGIAVGAPEYSQLLKISASRGEYFLATKAFNAMRERYPSLAVSLYNSYIKACVKTKVPPFTACPWLWGLILW